jgi:peptide/nickel transport system permease protein
LKTEASLSARPGLGQILLGVPAFILRRLLFIVILAFAIVYFCTLGMRLTVNSTTNINRQTLVDAARPAFNETIDFFQAAFQGELGTVVRGVMERSTVPIGDVVADAYVTSAQLVATGIGLAAILGILAGGLAATRRHSPLSLSTLTLTVIGVSIPSFFLALLLRVADIAFYRQTGIGLVPVFSSSMDRTQSLLPTVTFPALVLAARPLAHITRVTFVSVSEILNRDFIRTAQSKGLSRRVVFWRHTLRNAGISILTAAVVSLRFALGSLPVVEIFFDWPGVGSTMLNAIFAGETRVVAAMGLALGVTFLLINLVVDLIYRWIDPRLRGSSNGRAA